MLVGVISDTHGLLRKEVFDLFADVGCIVHAGDIGDPAVLTELNRLAPVRAVYGNIDTFPLIEQLAEKELFQLEDVRVFVTHIGGQPQELRSRHPEASESDLVIFGHSHQALQIQDQGVLFFNPGSAGPRRFDLPVTVGKLEIRKGTIKPTIIELQL